MIAKKLARGKKHERKFQHASRRLKVRARASFLCLSLFLCHRKVWQENKKNTFAFCSAASKAHSTRPQMDERDLFVPEGAGDASAHPAPNESVPSAPVDLDEFDPLASAERHDLEESIPEHEVLQLEGAAQSRAKPPHDAAAATAAAAADKDAKAKKGDDDAKERSRTNRSASPAKPASAAGANSDDKTKPHVSPPPPSPPTPEDRSGEETFTRVHHAPLTETSKKPQTPPFEERENVGRFDVQQDFLPFLRAPLFRNHRHCRTRTKTTHRAPFVREEEKAA